MGDHSSRECDVKNDLPVIDSDKLDLLRDFGVAAREELLRLRY